MNRIDPLLNLVLRQQESEVFEYPEFVEGKGLLAGTALLMAVRPARRVIEPALNVLLRFEGDTEELSHRGLQIESVAGDVVVARGRLSAISGIADDLPASVSYLEASRPMYPELDCCLVEANANRVHGQGYKGAGVIVGIVDSALDWTHPQFIRPDGTSRVLYLWDQRAVPVSGQVHPSEFAFGVEYTRADINQALSARGRIGHGKPGKDNGHGTHIASIAAGGGVKGKCVGVAPEADIIFVSNRVGPALGDSASTLNAVQYVLKKAADLKRPVVINISQGDNLGAHDGSSNLEHGLDQLLGAPGQALVKSAGNEGDGGRHASGSLIQGETAVLKFRVDNNFLQSAVLTIWYNGEDDFSVAVVAPGGGGTDRLMPPTPPQPRASLDRALSNGNQVGIESTIRHRHTSDKNILITLDAYSALAIEEGTWQIHLGGVQVKKGTFDAWIRRGTGAPSFEATYVNNEMTITIPGTARKVITVGSYVSKDFLQQGLSLGDVSDFSSRGPTRDGRLAPDFCAPGQLVVAAKSRNSSPPAAQLDPDGIHVAYWGTSVAAPVVTGTIALMLQVDPTLTLNRIRDILRQSARQDTFTGSQPNHIWGYGKLDAEAALSAI